MIEIAKATMIVLAVMLLSVPLLFVLFALRGLARRALDWLDWFFYVRPIERRRTKPRS